MNSEELSAGVAEHLIDLVSAQVTSDPALSPAVRAEVLAAFPEQAPKLSGSGGVLAGMFVRSVAVNGFRGIGPRATLRVQPALGLTLIVGRNGCGKSSFAEATEFALTGDNQRWSSKSKIWKDGWRNLHDGAAPQIEVELQTESPDNPLTIAGEWAQGAGLDGAQWTTHRKSGVSSALDRSDLARPLELYRPFLSYSELGSLIDGSPTGMHDALYSVLGLEDLTAAIAALSRKRIDLDKSIKEAKSTRGFLLGELANLDDERARAVHALMSASTPDLDAISRAVLGVTDTSGTGALLSEVISLGLPTEQVVSEAAARLTTATTRLLGAATTDAAAGAKLMELLRLASTFADDADCRCPVCGVGELDEAWRVRTRQGIAEIRSRTSALVEAEREHGEALAAVRQLIRTVPPALSSPPIESGEAVRAWQELGELAQADPATLPGRLVDCHRRLRTAMIELQNRARAELSRLDDQWAPIARQVAGWVEQARAGAEAPERFKVTKAAEAWLKKASTALCDERMRPLAEQTQRVWTTLRQQSNVELGSVLLRGAAAARKVSLDVTVDGVEGAALGVMSQGELHALGLSLFLPRATAEQSPFRFLMIDDPVQSMDPAKVDGLARVLAEVASTRQVIVFTHDLRLPEAVRRLQIPATVLEVQRRERSVVEIHRSTDPVHRYLDDARALARTPHLPREEGNEIVTMCCRLALESAATSRVRRVLGENGLAQAAIDEQLDATDRTVQKLALALYFDRTRESDVLARMDSELGSWASEVVRACNKGAHGSTPEQLGELVKRTEKITRWLSK
ncbi:AAA family ATPase [Nocardia sp. NPDC056952]|uniref:AAA family ATPase n=1 Tax=Nocardia sp. NPDC056952 TaxID=3345979 RepID=UPI003628F814